MNSPFVGAFLVISFCLVATAGWADGLIYNLPEDGTGVEYTLSGNDRLGATELTICSVGRKLHYGEYHRWIEIRYSQGESSKSETTWALKFLIPEKHLGAGHDHFKHAIHGIVQSRHPGRKAKTTEVDMGHENLAALRPPSKQLSHSFIFSIPNATAIPEKNIETPFGIMKCRGIKASIPGPSGPTSQITESFYINDDIPFGVVSGIHESAIASNDSKSTETITLKIKSIIHNAKSAISECNWSAATPGINDFSESTAELIKSSKLNTDYECLAVDFQNRLSLVSSIGHPNQLSLLDLDSGKVIASVPSGKYQPTVAVFSGDGKTMAVDHPQFFGLDKPAAIRLLRVGEHPEEIVTIELPDASPVLQLALSHTGKHVAFQHATTTTIYSIDHQKPQLVLTADSYRDGQRRQIGAIALSGNGKQVAVASTFLSYKDAMKSRTEVSIWDVDTMQMRVACEGIFPSAMLAYSNSGRLLAVGSSGGSLCPPRVVVIDAESGEVVNEINFLNHPICGGSVDHLLFSRDDKTIITNSGGATSVWDVKSSEMKTAILSPAKASHLSVDNGMVTIVGVRWSYYSGGFFARGSIIQPKGFAIFDLDPSVAFAASENYKVIAISDCRMFGLKKWDPKADALSELKRLGGIVISDHVHVRQKKDAGRIAVSVSPNEMKSNGWLRRIVDADLTHLVHIKGIVSLQLGGGFGDEALSHISEMKRLEQLDLSKACVTKAGMKHLSKLSNLEGLQLPNIALGPDELAHLSELKQLRELPPVAKLDDETLMHVGNLTGLERLPWPIYGHDGATDAGISHLRSLSKLRSLMFQGSQVTNNGLQVLQELPDLTYIRLWECPNISDEGLEHVGSLKELKRLELTRTKGIRDEGLKHLQPLQKLTHLYLTSTSITDRGMLHLHSLASLEYLAIEDTKVTPEAVESIKQSLPNCRVSSGPASILGRAPMLLP